MALIISLDPSLTATGIAALRPSSSPDWTVGTLKSKPGKIQDERATYARMDALVAQAAEWIHAARGHDHVTLSVIEAPAFSKNTGMAHERAGLWWMYYAMLLRLAVPILVVKPNLRAKYSTGKGNAGKDEVMMAAARRYPGAAIANNNEADAVVLGAMGARFDGLEIEASLPAAHLTAMKTLAV